MMSHTPHTDVHTPTHTCLMFNTLALTGGHVNWMEASLEQLSTPLPPWAIRAGAREVIYHDPRNTTAAIVTCGGLCPGLNDVVAVSVFVAVVVVG